MIKRFAGPLVFALAFSLNSADPASAQADLLGPGAGFLSGGTSRVATDALDDWLGQRDYPTFGRSGSSLGLGGYRLLRSGVLVGFEFNGLAIGSEEGQGRHIGVSGGYATIGVGYLVDLSERVRVYPRLGVGAGGLALWIEREEDTRDFLQVLTEPVAVSDGFVSAGRDGMVVDLGIGAELLPGQGRGLLIGVRAGYLTGPFSSEWESPDYTVTGGPEASLTGPYARVTVGWAWTR